MMQGSLGLIYKSAGLHPATNQDGLQKTPAAAQHNNREFSFFSGWHLAAVKVAA
jgi:hypothetical protein